MTLPATVTEEEMMSRVALAVKVAFGLTPGPVDVELVETMRGLPAELLSRSALAFELLAAVARRLLREASAGSSEA